MAVNKNFVVKNGIEIAVNLIYGDSDLQKVGIGSTTPRSLLDVHGDFTAEKGAFISGITTTVDELNVGIGGSALTVLNSSGFAGFNTVSPIYNVEVKRRAGAGDTAAYFHGQVNVEGTLVPNNLRVAGMSTLSNVNIDNGEVEISKLEVSGLSTFSSNVDVNASLDVSNDINVGGGVTITNNGDASFTGIVTASAFYGDGSNLTGVVATSGGSIGVGSDSQFIGAGVTQLNFNSSSGSVSVDAPTAGIATVNVESSGVSIGLVLALSN